MSSGDMYTEIILDYYRFPRNKGYCDKPDIVARDTNPLCGDVIEIQIVLDKEKIKDIKFSGSGCAISQAAASMLTEMIKGKNITDAIKIKKDEILNLLGIEISPMRLKCALLGLKVLKMGVYNYLGQKLEGEEW